MMLYHAHFLAHLGQVFGKERFDAENDISAIEYAQQKLKSRGKGHEIWQGDRLVHRAIYS